MTTANIAALKTEIFYVSISSANIAALKTEVMYSIPPPPNTGRRVTVSINNYYID